MLACHGHAPTRAFFPFTIRLPATKLLACLPQPEEDVFIEELLPLIILYEKYMLKHDLKPFSHCPESPKQCYVFPGMYCGHSP